MQIRHEYGILIYLTTYLRQAFSKQQIFEKVWHMDSNSCYSAVSNTISRLRVKIEIDRKNPVYIKTVQVSIFVLEFLVAHMTFNLISVAPFIYFMRKVYKHT